MTQLQVYCVNTGEYVAIDGGQNLLALLDKVRPQLKFQPISALVNNKNEGLTYEVYQPKQVEFVPMNSPTGQRVYIRSLCMVLYRAVATLYPGATLCISHSISSGYFCRVSGFEPTAEDVARIRAKMQELIDANLQFERRQRLTEHVIQIFEDQGLEDKVKLLRTTHDLYTTYYRLDGLCDYYYGCLAPSTGMLAVFDLLPYNDGMLLLGFDRQNPNVPPQPVTQAKMYEAFKQYLNFNRIVGVRNAGELNEVVAHNNQAELINVAEALHEKYLGRISDEITHRYREGGARIVLIAGPSSSGKTTTTKRLAIQLMTNLLRPQMISLDNYFVNRDFTPRDADGDYDFESLYSLDLEQFNTDLQEILAGGTVELPYYNFALGRREHRGEYINLDEGSILLIEGIHGLNPELTASIDEKMKFRVYVSALTTIQIDDHNWIPTTDNRLLRRIVRDRKYRGTSATETIRRWASVRRGEEKWIFPYQENADATFNSSLLYEVSVMRQAAEEALRTVPADCPEYAEAYRLRRFLEYFTPISESYLPSTSLLREFLGGSSFHY